MFNVFKASKMLKEKMKIQFVVVAVLVAYVRGAAVEPEKGFDFVEVHDSFIGVEPAFIGSRNVISGIINNGDRLLHRGYYSKLAVSNAVQTQDIRYVTAASTIKISYISALAVGSTQSATAQITAGGVSTNNVTIRLTSARSAGFDFWVEIWGR